MKILYPSEYVFEKHAILRGLSQGEQFKRMEAGFYGEEKFHQYLSKFGLEHWTILRNKWLKNDGHFECDFIVITRYAIYVFEVKNYFGTFVYKNGQAYSRGRAITYNPINQARNARLHLQQILPQYHVKGALVFIGEHNQVCIQDAIEDIAILETNEVYEFIQQIKREEQEYRGRYLNPQEVLTHLQKFEIDPPYHPAPYTRNEMKKARAGIYCANCQQKVLATRADYIKCGCGLHESKEEAIIRTACEYGVLTYGEDFTISDIRSFVGNQASITYLRKILTKHFEFTNKATLLTLSNPGKDYSLLKNIFKYKLPKIMVYK